MLEIPDRLLDAPAAAARGIREKDALRARLRVGRIPRRAHREVGDGVAGEAALQPEALAVLDERLRDPAVLELRHGAGERWRERGRELDPPQGGERRGQNAPVRVDVPGAHAGAAPLDPRDGGPKT